MTHPLPSILFFNINGSGLGHLSTCLAYAHRLRGRARPVFLSLASAVDKIHDMGFEADYLVSFEWSRAKRWAWDEQVSLRLGMMLERVRPAIIVFDGTWPYMGFQNAAIAYGQARLVWSNLTLFRRDTPKVPVSERRFDLVLNIGEPGSRQRLERAEPPGRKVHLPPVTMLRNDQLLDRAAARDALGLEQGGRYALLSLGPGNRKNIRGLGQSLIEEMRARGYVVVWTLAPITVRDVPLPDGVVPISVYPLVRYMRAFDVFLGAAGYNACCEVIQSGLPSLLVPNTLVADDQTQRATMLADHGLAVVSACETPRECAEAVERLLALPGRKAEGKTEFELDGADRAADEILALIDPETRHGVEGRSGGPAAPSGRPGTHSR